MPAPAHKGVADMTLWIRFDESRRLDFLGGSIHVMTCWFMIFHAMFFFMTCWFMFFHVMVVFFHDMLVHDFPCHGGLFSCHDMLVHECSCHVVPFQDMLVHDFSYHGDSSFQSCTCWFMNVPCHVGPSMTCWFMICSWHGGFFHVHVNT